ncbi:hypothetical protein CYLTODRAFT_442343 [Cylindrobasidium torrendii FP15055 ss-10]|uniref:C2H2-type domain-containing protein n=1 Tax=Cylindrobasidium torrendii FP15055 ss-10 TaxID=1314674 RepID=A0A0D7BJY1_9AGAR|nr:hypothetical protein CYLTODRAFT_442343 [Cylindrobasidium torrendii FP15055 ss-10]
MLGSGYRTCSRVGPLRAHIIRNGAYTDSEDIPHQRRAPICPNCKKRFKRSSALTRHRETHDPATLNRFPCPKSGCGYRTRQACNLKTHMRLKHERKSVDNCQYESQIDPTPTSLFNHRISAHPSPHTVLSPPVHTPNEDSSNSEGIPINQCAVEATFGDIYPDSNDMYAQPDTPPELVPAVWNVPPMYPQWMYPYSTTAGHSQARALPFLDYLPEPTNLDFAFDFGGLLQNDIAGGFGWDMFQ